MRRRRPASFPPQSAPKRIMFSRLISLSNQLSISQTSSWDGVMYHQVNAFSASDAASAPSRNPALSRNVELVSSRFSQVRRHRFSSGVEAMVTVTFRYHPALPVRRETLLVSLPRRIHSRPGALRNRLAGMALDLAVLMHRTDRGAALRPV